MPKYSSKKARSRKSKKRLNKKKGGGAKKPKLGMKWGSTGKVRK